MGAIKNINKGKLFDEDKHYQICKLISNNDITFDLLLEHTKYIKNTNSKYLCIILCGSYFMNKFLRNYFSYKNNKIITDPEYLTKVN